jgi:hypothetical protein
MAWIIGYLPETEMKKLIKVCMLKRCALNRLSEIMAKICQRSDM